jgi:hypothetical protein
LGTKRWVALLVVLTAALTLPSGAFARTLSITKAKSAAQKFLDQQNSDYPYEAPKKLTSCRRKSARTVDCGYKAVNANGNGTADCGTVRVRLKSRKARRPTVQFKGSGFVCAP